MTLQAGLWAFTGTFILLAVYVWVGIESRRYRLEDKFAMRFWGIIFAILAIWSLCWAISVGS